MFFRVYNLEKKCITQEIEVVSSDKKTFSCAITTGACIFRMSKDRSVGTIYSLQNKSPFYIVDFTLGK
jgi:predicted RNA-binding Zn-ribbon protein involved in translation (DUF1610 family)